LATDFTLRVSVLFVNVPSVDAVTVAEQLGPDRVALILLMNPVATPLRLLYLVTVRCQVPDCLTLNVRPSGPVHLLNEVLVMVPMFLPASLPPLFSLPFADADLHCSLVLVLLSTRTVLPALPVYFPPGFTVNVGAAAATAIVA